MPRNRVIYNTEAVFIGPAPSSGFHFINELGELSNTGTANLIHNLGRVQGASYSVTTNYINSVQLGKRGLVSQDQIVAPTVNLAIDYISRNLINEARLGFYCNYYNSQSSSTTPVYANNFGVSLLSGFVSRDLKNPSEYPYWPLSYRDKRNIFIVVSPEGQDVNQTGYYISDPNNRNFYVYSFGDCYLSSYTNKGSVGAVPICSTSFQCENLEILASGTGVSIPALNPQTYSNYTGILFNIPSTADVVTGEASAFLPGDINLSFASYPRQTGVLAIRGTGYARTANSSILDIGASISDIKVQEYDLSIPLPREPLYAIGYKAPVDRTVVFPILASLNISATVGDAQTGKLANIFNQNQDYDVSISFRNPRSARVQGIGSRFDLKRAKLNSYSYLSSIGQNKQIALNWSVEIDPDDLSKGLFMSGVFDVPIKKNYILTQNTPFNLLLSNAGDKMININSTEILF